MLLNLDRARREMDAIGVDALIAATPVNVIYMSDFASEFLLGGFDDNVAAVVLPREGNPTLIIPEFDLPYAVASPSWIEDVCTYGNPWSSVGVFMSESVDGVAGEDGFRGELAGLRADVASSQRDNFDAALIDALGRAGLAAARIGCDDLRLAGRLEEAGIGAGPIADTKQAMRRIRMVKTPAELAILSEGAAINASALRQVIAAGHIGMQEADLIRVYRSALTQSDARYLGERGMMFGPGDASGFSLPAGDERVLTPGDAVVLDCLGTWRRYHMDMARTAVVGDPTGEQENRYAAVAAALDAVETGAGAGVHTRELRRLAAETIAGFDLRADLTSITTHGLGLEVFEFPQADGLAEGFSLEAGMVVNTEIFYRDPQLGAFHLEDSVVVEENGCRRLDDMARDLVAFH